MQTPAHNHRHIYKWLMCEVECFKRPGQRQRKTEWKKKKTDDDVHDGDAANYKYISFTWLHLGFNRPQICRATVTQVFN